LVEIIHKAAAAKNTAPINPNPMPTFSAPLAVAAADEEDEVADPVLEAPDDAPVEVAVVLADAFEEVEAELSDLEDSEADAADVTDAEAEDEDEAAAEVAAAPVPVEVKTAVRRDPTSPLATQVPATDLLIS
jgi:hypothetical protein